MLCLFFVGLAFAANEGLEGQHAAANPEPSTTNRVHLSTTINFVIRTPAACAALNNNYIY